jgi:multidrug efflux pump subunit AcrB
MASAVATPLEKQFGEIPYLTQMTSTSSLGYTQIILQFDINDGIDAAAQLVQTAINAASGQLNLVRAVKNQSDKIEHWRYRGCLEMWRPRR